MLSASLFFIAVAADDWESWKQEHGKVYNGDEEEAHRRSVFEANMANIPALQKANPDAEFGSTYLSDLTDDELSGGYIPSDNTWPEVSVQNVTAADSQDWSDKATTPIKNQGQCGSCWAFSATEQMESMHILKYQSKVVLAPQELVDCKGDRSQRNGCAGGYPASGWDALEQLGGMSLETDYPYTGRNGRCSFKSDTAKVKVLSHGSVSGESKMKDYISSTAPLSICHQTGGWSSYRRGIMTRCGSGGGHCTQLVGYGNERGKTYWKVRNSWAARWGEDGYIRIQYGKELCGIKAGMTVDVASVGDGAVLV